MYFSGKISYTGESETGEQVSVTEVVLVKDESYTGAEAALYTYCEENGISDFSLDITKKKINNLLCTDVFPYYEFKVAMMSESASGKPKKLTDIVIVGAEDFQKAFDKVKVDYKNYLIPAEVESGKLTTFTSYVETAQEEVEEDGCDNPVNEYPLPDTDINWRPLKEVVSEYPGIEPEEAIRGNRKSSAVGHVLTEEIVMEPTERTLAVGRSDEGDIFESFKSLPGVLSPLPDNMYGPTNHSGPKGEEGQPGVLAPENGQRMTVIREDIDVASGRTATTYSQDIPETEVSKEQKE
jgi:hypothetical protein